MVAIDPSSRPERQAGSLLSRIFRASVIVGAVIGGMVIGERISLQNRLGDVHGVVLSSETVQFTPGLRSDPFEECRFYLAESAIPYGGLGMYAGVGITKGDLVGNVDICIYVADTPDGTHLSSHTWGRGTFFGQYEGSNSRAACEGFTTQYNTMPVAAVNTKIMSMREPTNAGLDRKTHPGAGAITHFYGIHSLAVDHIPAGSELTIDYGDWDFDDKSSLTKPGHEPEWLKENGMCVDNIEIRPAVDPSMGRGAFATRPLRKGSLVGPAPLQIFQDRSDFFKNGREALFVNYCFQPKDSSMLLFPYGPSINLINHNSKPNVGLQWSTHKMHHSEWLELPQKKLFDKATPGGLLLEVVALRDIKRNEELFFDYGPDWEETWKTHVQDWKPTLDEYVYPADMDETTPLRTVEEQKTNPNPPNLRTVCNSPDWDRKESNTITWQEPSWQWPEGNLSCHILKREKGDHGDYLYTVEVIFKEADAIYDPTVEEEDRYIDLKVPRRAIRFVDRSYTADEHLPGVFRHPLQFPAELVPKAWM
jgi:hypothetical protein